VKLIDIIPGLLWVAFAVFVLVLFRRQIRALLPRVRTVKLGLFEAKLDAAIDAAAETRNVRASGAQRTRVTRRALRDAEALAGARILWIDDDQPSTTAERAALEALDVEVVTATDDAQARRRLSEGSYDLLISDIKRGTDKQAGVTFAQELRAKHHGLPIIFYIRKLDPDKPLPGEAFGLTNRPDELMNLTMDALERRRG
jgi:CheY-like chemotaxis protein